MEKYSDDYYSLRKEGARKSAQEVIPFVLDITAPKSIVDVGCGTGLWLSVFNDFGINEVLGIDGEWVDEELLDIPKNQFKRFDLEKPIVLDREFDLVVSLEVAEHLPEECAENFIKSLTKLSPVILFSAAIPFQGGRNHINEQWPDYWAELFKKFNYLPIDCIRREVWNNENVKTWYKQNIMLYIKEGYLQNNPKLLTKYQENQPNALSIVHPQQYLHEISKLMDDSFESRVRLKTVLPLLPKLILNAIRIKISSLLGKKKR